MATFIDTFEIVLKGTDLFVFEQKETILKADISFDEEILSQLEENKGRYFDLILKPNIQAAHDFNDLQIEVIKSYLEDENYLD